MAGLVVFRGDRFGVSETVASPAASGSGTSATKEVTLHPSGLVYCLIFPLRGECASSGVPGQSRGRTPLLGCVAVEGMRIALAFEFEEEEDDIAAGSLASGSSEAVWAQAINSEPQQTPAMTPSAVSQRTRARSTDV